MWRTREKKLLDELEAALGQRRTKHTAPEPVHGCARDCCGGQGLADAVWR